MSAAPALRGRDMALVLVIVAVWAINFLTSALGLREIPPLLFTALRFGLLLLPLLFLMKKPPSDQWPRLAAVSLCIGVVHFSLSFTALKLAGDLSSPAIVLQSYVPMTTVLAWWLLGEKVGWRTCAAIALSFLGVLVLGLDPHVLGNPVALATMLASAFALAVGTILMKGLRGLDVYSQQGWMAVFSLPSLLLLSAWLEPGAIANLPEASWVAWLGAAFAAYASSLLGHGLYYWLVQRHPVAQITPWLLLVPVGAMLLGVAFWGDHPGPRVLIGGAMVLAGVLVIALRAKVRPRTLAEPA
ncbi:DMT family transporter [Thermomonas sp.]|uniref:DMT family transporter n=1 Tax=Thermomonas sp. TaxID=1971895 RepID=UPI0024880CC7|nr:DMT family transporter [Thermomonas sp.]MDI1254154.1 DMT family transporter [Thermomonas sp.]